MNLQKPPIVVFDGVCTLCNSTVDFLIRNDRTGTLLFGSFQDEHIADLLKKHGVTSAPDSVYLIEGGVLYQESEAALRLVRYLGGAWRVFRVFAVVPAVLRNAIYRWVARNRYRWFGKRDVCRIPTQEERHRFL